MNNNYKSTLNLPKTKFPMRGNLINSELKTLERWINDDLYGIIRAAKRGKKIFILHDGPPYANGSIHIGHSVNKILKDIIIKYKGLDGFDSPYVPGWDCHGLPIEMEVEYECNQYNKKFTDTEFRAKCRRYAAIQVDNQRKDFVRLGVLGDWLHPYLTMDFKTEANIIRTLGKIISNGHLYKGVKPVHWCTNCCSTLAEAEVEYYNKISVSIDTIFEAVDQDAIKNKFDALDVDGPISLIIWTTTPWTLPASRGVALAPKFDYVLVQIKNKALILAKNLIDKVMQRLQISDYTLLGVTKSNDLESMYFKHPFLNYSVPLVLSDHVTLDIGTGVVHIAGSHGQDDYNVSLKYNLKITNQIGPDGSYLPGTYPSLDGINIFKADGVIVDLLRNRDKLLHVENLQHIYPHCWRHRLPVILRATPQWFISMEQNGLRKRLLEVIKNVRWIPNWTQARIKSMIENRPDWCISRQRVWGVPLSLFIHKKTCELHPRTLELIEEVAKLVEVNGIQAWWDLDPYEIIGNDADFYEKLVSDILDVWFDSGSTHTTIVEERPEFAKQPVDMYLEGSDQHRGWFMSSLMISVATKNKAPYNQVLTHGFIVDNYGYKMSKSIGNVVYPQDLINDFGADIFRLWVASIDYTNEIAVSNEVFKRTTDTYRRIRNTFRFLLANLNDFDPVKNIVEPRMMVALDRWAINCAKLTQEDIIKSYKDYNFHEVVQRLIHFCSVEMGSFYLDIIKDRQYTLKADSVARRSCQTALYHISEALVRWIAPIISFTADEIWNYLPGKREKYIFIVEWYKKLFSLSETELMNNRFWSDLLKIRNTVNKVFEHIRVSKKINNSLEAFATLYVEPELAMKLSLLDKELQFFLLVSGVKIADYVHAVSDAQQSELLEGLKVSLDKAEGKKCLRCWYYTTDIGQITEYAEICGRCINNIIGDGEKRRFI